MITAFLRNFSVTVLVLFILAWFVPAVDLGYPVGTHNFTWSIFISRGLPVLLTTSIFLVLLTMLVKPILKVIGAPINFLTLGLFNVVISGLMFFIADMFVPGFEIHPLVIGSFTLNIFFTYIVIALLFGLLESVISIMF